MAKIGRNEPCPCGSGRKFKHCCLRGGRIRAASRPGGITPAERLRDGIAEIQRAAAGREDVFFELGVFLLFSTAQGDAWLLEITESDALQVARAGAALEPPIEEGGDTIAINWSHAFRIQDRQLTLTAHADQAETPLPEAPARRIVAAIRRIRKRYDQALLDQVHLAADAQPGETGG